MKLKFYIFSFLFFFINIIMLLNCFANENIINNNKLRYYSINKAFISDEYNNESVVFSIALKKIFCKTIFTNVDKQAAIYHIWYYKDNLIKEKQLLISPKKYSINSEICLRETDKGPWRVEVLDEERRMLKIIRFSVID